MDTKQLRWGLSARLRWACGLVPLALVILMLAASVGRADLRKAVREVLPATVAVEWQGEEDERSAAHRKQEEADVAAQTLQELNQLYQQEEADAAAQTLQQLDQLYQLGYVARSELPKPPDAVSLSSGTVVSPDGLIATLTGETGKGSYSVTFDDGRTLPARLLVDDRRSGLKLLKVDADDLPCVRLAEGEAEMGQAVVAVLCTDLKDRAVAQGIISATDRSFPGVPCEVLQTDVSIGAMSAGAPLADEEGRVLGIIAGKGGGVMIREPKGLLDRTREAGLAFAIPASFVQSLLEARQGDNTVVVHGGLLGIQIESPTEGGDSPIAKKVFPDTPAEAVGIQEGDEIVAVDGQETSTSEDVVRRVRRRAAGERITVTVRRDGEERRYEVALGRFPPKPQTTPPPPTPVERVVPEAVHFWDYDGDGRPDIVKPSGDAKQSESVARALEFLRRAQEQAQPKPPVIRVQRSDVDKKLDQLTDDVQSLRDQIQKLTEEVQKLQGRPDDDPAEEP